MEIIVTILSGFLGSLIGLMIHGYLRKLRNDAKVKAKAEEQHKLRYKVTQPPKAGVSYGAGPEYAVHMGKLGEMMLEYPGTVSLSPDGVETIPLIGDPIKTYEEILKLKKDHLVDSVKLEPEFGVITYKCGNHYHVVTVIGQVASRTTQDTEEAARAAFKQSIENFLTSSPK